MGSKIINRIPSDAALLGGLVTVVLLSFGLGWLVRGDSAPTQVEVVETDTHPMTDALLDELEAVSAATAVGLNRRDFQVALQKLTLAYQRFERSNEKGVPEATRSSFHEAYKDYLFAQQAWEWSLGRKSEYDTGWIRLFSASARTRYGLDGTYKVEERTWAKVYADFYVSGAFSHASKEVEKARAAFSN